MKKIILVPSGGTNLASIASAIRELGYEAIISSNKKEILNADKIILPGVGRALQVIQTLQQLDLLTTIKSLKQDVLGICVGMQLLCATSEEDNQTFLGIIHQPVIKLPPSVVVPHMGWNQLVFSKKHPLLNNIEYGDFVYFTHSFYLPQEDTYTLAHSTHDDIKIAAIIQKDNFYGVQFHPERSVHTGLQILKNFIEL